MLVARSVLSERTLGDHKSPYLPLIEELCREGDRLLEEARKERDDLQQQAGIFCNSLSLNCYTASKSHVEYVSAYVYVLCSNRTITLRRNIKLDCVCECLHLYYMRMLTLLHWN